MYLVGRKTGFNNYLTLTTLYGILFFTKYSPQSICSELRFSVMILLPSLMISLKRGNLHGKDRLR